MMKITDRKFLNVDTPSCHAATVAYFQSKPVYSWFGGTQEGAPDSSIYIQHGDKIVTIGGEDNIPRWNPILFPYEDKLFLFVKLGVFCDRWASIIYNISDIFEDNFNIKKIIPQILPAGLNVSVKTKPIECGGLIYCGSSVEALIDWAAYIETYKIKDGIWEYVDRSRPLTVPKRIYDDPYYGKRMTMGIIQPSLWFNKTLHAFFRSSRGLGKIYYSQSVLDSLGRHFWSEPIATKFNNPNSGIDTVYTNGRLFLVHNPSETQRIPLVISELDEEFNIIDEICISDKLEGRVNTQELSYPYLIENAWNEGELKLVYTYGRKRVEAVTIEI